MPLTNAFHEAVASGNVRRVRIMMKDSLLVDLAFHEFDEMVKATESMPNLYDTHDNRVFETNESAWNDDYMNKLMVQIVGNFSKERIEHLKAVVRKLRPVDSHAEQQQKDKPQRRSHFSLPHSSAKSLESSYKKGKREAYQKGEIVEEDATKSGKGKMKDKGAAIVKMGLSKIGSKLLPTLQSGGHSNER